MILAIVIFCITVLAMILSILFFPKIKIGKKFSISSYWVITLVGLIILLLFGLGDIKTVVTSLTQNTAINPIKILVLFISMTVLSIFLDELGFFKYLASVTLKKAKTSQFKLFLYLYLTVSVLTVFTSNDIIILSFTPFICYFFKSAKINPVPYLAAEFVAANTWSMALIIGNPTNIYLGTAYGINFIEYVKVMIVPTLLSGITAFAVLMLLFGKKLKSPVCGEEIKEEKISDKVNLSIGVFTLAVCTVALAVCSYIGVEMWIISLSSVVFLFVAVSVSSLIRKIPPKELLTSLKRAPWELIPFVLSMFSIIIILSGQGITEKIADFLQGDFTELKYGITSFLSANLINNIPMSVLFSSVMESTAEAVRLKAVFSCVVGSNLGAIFTPIGALAGIMWNSILTRHGVKFKYFDFLKMGLSVGVPTLIVSLFSLMLFI